MIEYFLIALASLFESYFIFYASSIISRKQSKVYYFEKISVAIILFLKTIIIYKTESFHLLGMIVILVTIFMLIYSCFGNDIVDSFKILTSIYIIMILGEIVVSLLAALLNINFNDLTLTNRSIISFTSIFTYIIILNLFKVYLHRLKYNKKYQSIRNYLMILILFFTSLMIMIYMNAKLSSYNILIWTSLIIQLVLLVIFIVLSIRSANRGHINAELEKDVRLILNLLKREKKINHEYINDLLILKNYLSSNEIVNGIIDKYINNSNTKQFQRNSYTVPGNLKTILENKISIIEKEGIEYHFADNIKKYNIDSEEVLIVSKLLAIFLDNAIEASNSPGNAFILINFYDHKPFCTFEVTNWFCNDSKKAPNKGNGLKIAKELVKRTKYISLNTVINGDYYIQTIKIKKPLG